MIERNRTIKAAMAGLVVFLVLFAAGPRALLNYYIAISAGIALTILFGPQVLERIFGRRRSRL